jgi:hypothetical protein
MVRKASKNLARLLELLGEYSLSREVYKKIFFVSSACRLYDKELRELAEDKSE